MKVTAKALLILMCVITASNMDAQIGLRRQFFHEFRMGGNSSEMDIKDGNRDKKAKIGFHFGYVATYKFREPIQLQTGVFLTKKGLKQSISIHNESPIGSSILITKTRHEIDANYVQVPLMIGWESDYTKMWIFNINAGIYGAWGFKGKTTKKVKIEEIIGSGYDAIVTNTNEKWDTFSSDVLKKFDYGLIASAGFIYDIYTFNLSYEYGLYNISQTNQELRNRNLTVSIGLRF